MGNIPDFFKYPTLMLIFIKFKTRRKIDWKTLSSKSFQGLWKDLFEALLKAVIWKQFDNTVKNAVYVFKSGKPIYNKLQHGDTMRTYYITYSSRVPGSIIIKWASKLPNAWYFIYVYFALINLSVCDIGYRGRSLRIFNIPAQLDPVFGILFLITIASFRSLINVSPPRFIGLHTCLFNWIFFIS